MKQITDVKYIQAEKLSASEKEELTLDKDVKGMVVIRTYVEDGKTTIMGEPIDNITTTMQNLSDIEMLEEIQKDMPEVVKQNIRDIAVATEKGEEVPFNPELELYFLLQRNLRQLRSYTFEEVQKIVFFQKAQFTKLDQRMGRLIRKKENNNYYMYDSVPKGDN